MIRTISITDFELAREAWGLPDHMDPTLSILRTIYQIWLRGGQNFEELRIVYKRGGSVTISVPKILEESSRNPLTVEDPLQIELD